MNPTVELTYRTARRIAIAVVGSTVLLVGIIMIVAPGPAIVVIPVGLAILGLEFAWAKFWLSRLRKSLSSQGAKQRAEYAEVHRERHSGR